LLPVFHPPNPVSWEPPLLSPAVPLFSLFSCAQPPPVVFVSLPPALPAQKVFPLLGSGRAPDRHCQLHFSFRPGEVTRFSSFLMAGLFFSFPPPAPMAFLMVQTSGRPSLRWVKRFFPPPLSWQSFFFFFSSSFVVVFFPPFSIQMPPDSFEKGRPMFTSQGPAGLAMIFFCPPISFFWFVRPFPVSLFRYFLCTSNISFFFVSAFPPRLLPVLFY